MFDNPSKNLQRLQDELLAAEEAPWEPEEDDPEQAYQDAKRILAQEAWNETQRDPLYYQYIPEEPIYDDEEEYTAQPSEQKKKKGSSLGLFLMLIAEAIMLGVLAAVWWTKWH